MRELTGNWKQFAGSVRYVYAYNRHVNLREGIYCNKSLPKHKPITEDLDNNIQDFKTERLGL